jgi:hypothetical protein
VLLVLFFEAARGISFLEGLLILSRTVGCSRRWSVSGAQQQRK